MSYAIQCAFHKTHGHSPGVLVFIHDIFIPVLISYQSLLIGNQSKRESKTNLHGQPNRKIKTNSISILIGG